MAEEEGQERTEAPTQRRREDARREGRTAVSQDLASGALLLVGVLMLLNTGPRLADGLRDQVRRGLLGGCGPDLTAGTIEGLVGGTALQLLDWLGPLFGVVFAATAAVGMLQAGFHITPELLSVRWEKLDPAAGVQRLFSWGAVVRALTALLRVAAVAVLVWWVLRGRAAQVAGLGEAGVAGAAAQAWEIVVRLAVAVAAALFLIGVLDYAYQRYKFEQSLRMTRQELKEELKREEGDPQIKQRIRRLQREAAQRRMLREVPRATVVVTNPVHLAIALRYDRATMPAPRVVAVGSGFTAQRIAATARRHGVPVLERPTLARALYKTVRVDQEVPAALYQVMAELLAFVYRLRGLA